MNSQILALKIAAAIFLLVCVVHLLRLIFRIKVTVGNFVIPLWFGLVGALVTLSLFIWMISVLK